MGNYIHIPAGSIKVCKDEGCIVKRHIGHIAACPLGLSSQYIKQLSLHHKLIKFLCFRGKLTVHLPARFQNFLRGAEGCGISFLKVNLFINIA